MQEKSPTHKKSLGAAPVAQALLPVRLLQAQQEALEPAAESPVTEASAASKD
jgi:hypothetical protein